MDWSLEKYPWLSLLPGFALVFVWGVISLGHAYDRNLTKMKDSVDQGFMLVGRLDGALDALARLRVDQQAFLSTGDERFQDGVIESVETLTIDIAVLNSLAAKNKSERALLFSLSRSIEQVLGSVGESDHIMELRGKAEAVAFFDSQEDSIPDAKGQAEQLRIQIAGRISDRIRTPRTANPLLRDVLVPLGVALERAAAFSKSVRLNSGTAGTRYARISLEH